jgi:hypothetical protein
MPKLLLRLSALLVLTALAASACAPRPSGPSADPGLLFKDNFSTTDTGWDQYTGAEGTVNYDQGQYLIKIEQPKIYLWGTPGLDLTDALVEAEAAYAAGPVNNEYGLICRFTKNGDKSSFYFFVISSDGYYASGKVVKNQLTYLDPSDFKASPVIQPGPTAVNHLAATCQGNTLTFAVNSQPVSKFRDSELTHGDIGLLAGTFDEAGVGIHFYDVVVRKP